jgi:nucleotide-binding universal stress UspA family protein
MSSGMDPLKKILVPYDGSRPSENALNQALMLAEGLSGSAEVTLLNVVQKIVLPPMIEAPHFRSRVTGDEITSEALIKELSQELREAAGKMLSEKREKAQQSHQRKNVTIKTKVLIGYPADEIVKYAKEENMEMIVIGNVGLSGVSRLKALGSVSRGVSERAPCPVLIAR